MSSTLLAILGSLICLGTITNGQSCDAFTDEISCEQSSSCTWISSNICRCASEVKQDILLNIDSSGSIGWSNFQTQKTFIKTLVTQGISNGSNIGFFIFSTYINESRPIQHWDDDELLNYAEGLHYQWRSSTNTGGVLSASLDEFDRTYDPERQQILMLITDGIPCLPGNCPHSVCGYANSFLSAGIWCAPYGYLPEIIDRFMCIGILNRYPCHHYRGGKFRNRLCRVPRPR